jgi:hypothetical protein
MRGKVGFVDGLTSLGETVFLAVAAAVASILRTRQWLRVALFIRVQGAQWQEQA